tara:strand:- start:5238 stop:5531 length:294 start_codon:yes stop_codon:yes gene_type:complete
MLTTLRTMAPTSSPSSIRLATTARTLAWPRKISSASVVSEPVNTSTGARGHRRSASAATSSPLPSGSARSMTSASGVAACKEAIAAAIEGRQIPSTS